MSFVPFDNESNKTSVFKKNLLIQVINDIEKLMREVYEQPRIYETGLSQELPDIFGFGSEDGWIDITLSDYLASLNAPMIEFQDAINSYDGDTRMNYADQSTQILYVLKYYHIYWYQIYNALNFLREDLVMKRDLRIALFCAGPAPELIGITRFLEENPRFSSIQIDFYDEIDEWQFARKNFLFSNSKIELMRNNLKMKFNFYKFDLTRNEELERFEARKYYDVISFQNCLGEFADANKDNQVRSNTDGFLTVLKSLKNNGKAIFTERSVSNTVNAFKEIKHFCAENNFRIILDEYTEKNLVDNKNDKDFNFRVPSVLSNLYSSKVNLMKTNRFKTLIITKPFPLSLNNPTGPNTIYKKDHRLIGNKIDHKDFGIGLITNFHEEGVVIDFELHGECELDFPMTTSRFKWIQFSWNAEFEDEDMTNLTFREVNPLGQPITNTYSLDEYWYPVVSEEYFHEDYGWGKVVEVIDENRCSIFFSKSKKRINFPLDTGWEVLEKDMDLFPPSDHWFPVLREELFHNYYGWGYVSEIFSQKVGSAVAKIHFYDFGFVKIKIHTDNLKNIRLDSPR